jgi:hypothetical protein
MAIYVANTSGPWDVLSTWLTSSATIDTITPTASGWAVATVLPTMQDDVYANNKNVILQSSSFVHTARIITNKSLLAVPAGSVTAVIIASGSSTAASGFFLTSTGSKTYYISCSYFNGNNGTATQMLFVSASATTTRTIVYITGSIVHNQDSVTALVNMPGNSSSIYVNGDVIGGGVGSAILLAGNQSTVEVTGSVYGGAAATQYGISMTGLFATCSISGNLYAKRGPALHMNSVTGSRTTIYGDVYASTAYYAISASLNTSSRAHNVYIYGSVINDASTGQTALTGTRFFISSSYVNGTATQVKIKYQPQTTAIALQVSSADTTPAAADVYKGVVYGTGQTKIGSLTTPNVADVRSTVSYYTGSVGSTPTSQIGQCYMPHSSSVRVSISYDSASTPGAMVVPLQNQVQYGVFFSTGSLTGSYQSASQYWSTSSNSFTQVSSSGYLLSRSLDTPLGSISGTFVTDLNNTATTSNTILRMQNVHTTQSVSQSIGSYN